MAKKHNIRIGRITIADESFPAVINVKLLMDLKEKGFDLTNILESPDTRFENLCFLLAQAINNGFRLSGADDKITVDELIEMISLQELASVVRQLSVLLGYEGREVEADPPKN